MKVTDLASWGYGLVEWNSRAGCFRSMETGGKVFEILLVLKPRALQKSDDSEPSDKYRFAGRRALVSSGEAGFDGLGVLLLV